MGLRLEILSGPGEDFRYDLVFDEFVKAVFTDEVRTINGLKIIIGAKDLDLLRGAELDHDDAKGLLIRNPNKPLRADIEGLVADDEISAQIEAIVFNDVNPALSAHGGFVTFAGHDKEGTAYFTMGGGCHGCSMSRQTMLDGVQTMLVEQVPAITRVRDITDPNTITDRVGQSNITCPGSAPACFGDLDGSGEVDSGDVALALLDSGSCAGCPADLDGSGEVDSGDVALILLSSGTCQ